jgi:PAS domain S-box-containing protein
LQFFLLDTNKIEQSPDCISAYDSDLRILVWNAACEKKYGISKEEALSQNLLHLFPHIEEDYRVRCFRRSVQEQQSFFFPNLPLLYGAGIYSQLVLPLHNDTGEVFGSLNIVREGEYRRIKKEDLVQPLYKAELAHHGLLHTTTGR